MNKKQKFAIWMGIFAIAATIIYPPWIKLEKPFNRHRTMDDTAQLLRQIPYELPGGYYWIFSDRFTSPIYHINDVRLALQLFIVLMSISGLCLIFGDKKKNQKHIDSV